MAIKGSLKEASLPDVVQLLAMGQKTGCLAVAHRRADGKGEAASLGLDGAHEVNAGHERQAHLSREHRHGRRGGGGREQRHLHPQKWGRHRGFFGMTTQRIR